MGCNCKNENGSIEDLLNNNEPSKKLNIVQTIIKYSLKILGFLIMLVFLPIINLGIIWIIFRTLILNKNVDFKPLLTKIGGLFQSKEYDDDDDDDDEEYNEDNFTMLNVEDITKKSK